jgi:hypothetical protein
MAKLGILILVPLSKMGSCILGKQMEALNIFLGIGSRLGIGPSNICFWQSLRRSCCL